MSDLVTVIIPAFNIEAEIHRCLRTVTSQTHRRLEVIVIDDGSSDNTAAVIEEVAAGDPRIIFVQQPNSGLSGARNTGLDRASGDYICFVDGDDWLEPHHVSGLLATLTASGAQVAMSEFFIERPNQTTRARFIRKSSTVNRRDALLALYGPDSLMFVLAWNKLYRASVFKDMRFLTGLIHEDEEIADRWITKSTSVALLRSATYHYDQREGSITRSPFSTRRLDLVEAYEKRTQRLLTGVHRGDFSRKAPCRLARVMLNVHSEALLSDAASAENDALTVRRAMERSMVSTQSPPAATKALLRFTLKHPHLSARGWEIFVRAKKHPGQMRRRLLGLATNVRRRSGTQDLS